MSAALEPVRRAEEARREALLLGNTEALAALLSESLVYVHTNGAIDSKKDVVQKLSSGTLGYLSIAEQHAACVAVDRQALFVSSCDMDVIVRGVPKRLECLTTGLWALEGSQWRLVYYRSSRREPAHVPDSASESSGPSAHTDR